MPLTDQQREEIATYLIKKLDVEKDGKISLPGVISALGMDDPEKIAVTEKYFKMADTNGDGQIEKSELIAFLKKVEARLVPNA